MEAIIQSAQGSCSAWNRVMCTRRPSVFRKECFRSVSKGSFVACTRPEISSPHVHLCCATSFKLGTVCDDFVHLPFVISLMVTFFPLRERQTVTVKLTKTVRFKQLRDGNCYMQWARAPTQMYTQGSILIAIL